MVCCNSPITVTTTATRLICNNVYGYRRQVTLQNVGEVDVYIGHKDCVTESDYDYKLEAGETLQVFDNCKIYGIASAECKVAVLSSNGYY